MIQNMRYYILYYDSDNHIYTDSIISTAKETIQIYRNSEKTDQENLYACIITTYNQLLLAEIGNTDLNEVEVTEYIKQFESIIEKDDFTGLGMISQNKTEFLLRKGDYDAAEKEALKGLDLTDKQPEYERGAMLRNSYEMLRAIYEAMHNYKKALEYETKANVLTREKDHSEQYQVIKDLESKYDFEKKEQEIQFLGERNRTQAQIQWLFVGISVLLLIIFFLFSHRTRTRRKILLYQMDQLRYRTVQSKFIPHFTGNVLNSINYLISKDPDSAQKYIADFGIFSNRTLFNAEKLYQSLQEELEYMEAYLILEKLRFEEKLNYTIHIDPAIDTRILMPIMVLQTFCNNALKHGLWPKPGGGTIKIEGYLKEDYIVLAVEDNGIGREKAKALKTGGTGEGLKIVSQQLEFYNKEKKKKASFKLIDLYDSDHNPAGTRVEYSTKICNFV
jgi:tetratricopeptide (TPR) repeat protein